MSSKSFTLITTTSSLTLDFEVINIDASGGSLTVTLPDIPFDGFSLILKRIDTVATNIVTVQGFGGQTIDLQATVQLNVNGNLELVAQYNTNWVTIRGSHNDVYGPNNEVQIKFQSKTLPILPYLVINTTAFLVAQYFVYRGSDFYGKEPVNLTIAFSLDSGTTNTSFTVKILDVTNAVQIATITSTASGDNGTYMTASTTAFTNIPTTESVFEIDTKLSVAGPPYVRLHAIYFQMA